MNLSVVFINDIWSFESQCRKMLVLPSLKVCHLPFTTSTKTSIKTSTKGLGVHILCTPLSAYY